MGRTEQLSHNPQTVNSFPARDGGVWPHELLGRAASPPPCLDPQRFRPAVPTAWCWPGRSSLGIGSWPLTVRAARCRTPRAGRARVGLGGCAGRSPARCRGLLQLRVPLEVEFSQQHPGCRVADLQVDVGGRRRLGALVVRRLDRLDPVAAACVGPQGALQVAAPDLAGPLGPGPYTPSPLACHRCTTAPASGVVQSGRTPSRRPPAADLAGWRRSRRRRRRRSPGRPPRRLPRRAGRDGPLAPSPPAWLACLIYAANPPRVPPPACGEAVLSTMR